MLIDNDTDDPVDYDIDVAGGGSGMSMTKEGGSYTVDPGSAPKFRIPARSQWSLELADPTATCRHIFQIVSSSQPETVIELRGAPGTDNVKLKQATHEGERYYRATVFT